MQREPDMNQSAASWTLNFAALDKRNSTLVFSILPVICSFSGKVSDIAVSKFFSSQRQGQYSSTTRLDHLGCGTRGLQVHFGDDLKNHRQVRKRTTCRHYEHLMTNTTLMPASSSTHKHDKQQCLLFLFSLHCTRTQEIRQSAILLLLVLPKLIFAFYAFLLRLPCYRALMKRASWLYNVNSWGAKSPLLSAEKLADFSRFLQHTTDF